MITLIACMAKNRVIGKNGIIPWHIKEDFKHFKAYTMNKKVLMGKTTFISLNEKPLPGRVNIVLTNNDNDYKDREDIVVIHSLDKIIEEYKNNDEELIIMGGASVYRQTLPFANKVVLSKINKDYDGDAYFPEFEENFIVSEVKQFEEFSVYYYCKGVD